jgi:hypothetical protein
LITTATWKSTAHCWMSFCMTNRTSSAKETPLTSQAEPMTVGPTIPNSANPIACSGLFPHKNRLFRPGAFHCSQATGNWREPA